MISPGIEWIECTLKIYKMTETDTHSQNHVRVSELTYEMLPVWDSYVDSHPAGTFFHLSGWKKVIERVYRHKLYYLYAEKNGVITGILPLGHVHSRLFSNALISVPFSVYGGVLANDSETRMLLENAALKLANKIGVDYVEYRNLEPVNDGLPVNDLYVTFRKEIFDNDEENMKSIPRKQRAMVRKGIDAGLVANHMGDVSDFFSVYAESVRNLGTPVFPKLFFVELKNEFGDDCEVTVIKKDGVVISSVMSFYYKDTVLPYYGGGTADARSYKANDFMYWSLMRRAVERHIKIFDFGRSKKGAGSYSFKKNWGFEPTPLSYKYALVKTDNLPEINPTNPKYKYFIKIWRRLPMRVANTLGPLLARNLA